MKKISIAFGIHNHQPVGNFDFVFEQAYRRAYLPFLELLEKHPQIRVAQHYSGILFQWIEEHKPEFIPRLRRMVESGQIEMMTGGFYEPILAVIPYGDKIGQIQKLTQFVRERTGYEPKGMWLAERIWEPQLPKPCAEVGVKYVVLDDSHFKNAGLKEDQLLGYYITEEEGATVYLFPISETLRYTIPFQAVEETLAYLRSMASEDGSRLVVFADDGEKFGIWPNTYEHCYEDGWLESFFQALEDNLDWIKIVHFSEALEAIKPLGRIYLPTASYREMMEWAMPTDAIHEYEDFEEALRQAGLFDKYKVFVRGGFWRNFMAKYPEANNMHKKMLHISQRLSRLERELGSSKLFREARENLWAGQCNCPYWHGVFGGLYLNHLRYATYRHFIRAERLLDQMERTAQEQQQGWVDCQRIDYDGDGSEEIVVSNKALNLYFAPHQGACLFELDVKGRTINLLDTMTRREESYHRKLRELSKEPKSTDDKVSSIHNLVAAKEAGLENYLDYDAYRRTALLDHFLAPDTTLEAFARSRYAEAGDFIDSPYESSVELSEGAAQIRFWRCGEVKNGTTVTPVKLEKKIAVHRSRSELHIDYRIRHLGKRRETFWFGVELDFALLAGDAEDRYYEFPGHALDDVRLRSQGECQNVRVASLRDDWLKLAVTIELEQAATFWRFPIETISQSESGFERVYQSSVVFPHWKFALEPGNFWTNSLVLTIEEL